MAIDKYTNIRLLRKKGDRIRHPVFITYAPIHTLARTILSPRLFTVPKLTPMYAPPCHSSAVCRLIACACYDEGWGTSSCHVEFDTEDDARQCRKILQGREAHRFHRQYSPCTFTDIRAFRSHAQQYVSLPSKLPTDACSCRMHMTLPPPDFALRTREDPEGTAGT